MPRAPDTALPFRSLRVLERGGGVAPTYAGKLFSDFGAEVIKVEQPGGDPLRREPPGVEAADGPESPLFAYLNCTVRGHRFNGRDRLWT